MLLKATAVILTLTASILRLNSACTVLEFTGTVFLKEPKLVRCIARCTVSASRKLHDGLAMQAYFDLEHKGPSDH